MIFNPRLVIREYGKAPDLTTGLAPDEVHIWHWEPVCPPPELPGLWNVLDGGEHQRAQRFHFSKHRDEFVVNRARMRSLLAGYVATSPEQLAFEYSVHGKPCLRDGGSLRFNLSHTHGRAALAIVQEREIGIDVEEIRPQCDARRIAERFFSAQERQALQGLTADKLDRAFFRGWTRKEAYIKAKGEGLSIPLHQFDVTLTETQPAMLVGTRPDPEEARRWILYDLPLCAGYAAALAVAVAPSLGSQSDRAVSQMTGRQDDKP
ncbi:MAG: 4'-phosphopantetheinyl transferase superfamily protein [Candidatus Sulfotelmatobacter sp.]